MQECDFSYDCLMEDVLVFLNSGLMAQEKMNDNENGKKLKLVDITNEYKDDCQSIQKQSTMSSSKVRFSEPVMWEDILIKFQMCRPLGEQQNGMFLYGIYNRKSWVKISTGTLPNLEDPSNEYMYMYMGYITGRVEWK